MSEVRLVAYRRKTSHPADEPIQNQIDWILGLSYSGNKIPQIGSFINIKGFAYDNAYSISKLNEISNGEEGLIFGKVTHVIHSRYESFEDTGTVVLCEICDLHTNKELKYLNLM